MVLAVVAVSLLVITGCGDDELEERVAQLAERESQLIRERDSLKSELLLKGRNLEQLELGKEALELETEELVERVASVNSVAVFRGQELQAATERKEEAEKALQEESERRSALEGEIRTLTQQIEALTREVSVTETERERVERDAQVAAAAHEERKRTDSIRIARLEMPVTARPGGYVNIAELSGAFGLGDTDPDFTRSIIGLTNIFGYSFSERFTGGVGTGVYFYNGGAMIPLFLDFRYSFPTSGEYRPMLIADGGMLFNLSDFGSSGAFINPSFGVERVLNQSNSLHISAGPLIQHSPSSFRSTFIILRGGYTFRAQ